MSAAPTVLVDANVFIRSEDRADPAKQQLARNWLRELWLRHSGRTSSQVLNEFYVTATRKLRPAMSAGDARAEVRRYQRWNPWLCDHATVENAWAIESRFQLSWWDALVVASAQQQGCSYLLTEDLQHGLQIDGVRIVNPFLVSPEILDTPAA
jgi:predicted nucleic acid-binding protein